MLSGIFNLMGAQSDCLRCEVCQNLFLSPMNTALLRPAVATALTVYGIETLKAVLASLATLVATALTVYGIETTQKIPTAVFPVANELQQHLPFTVLKHSNTELAKLKPLRVATALTVYGIETLT